MAAGRIHNVVCLFPFNFLLSKLTNQFESIMQNKPNLPAPQMNVNKVLTRDYENNSNWKPGENKANTKPIKANFIRHSLGEGGTNPIPTPKTSFHPQNKPNQTQFT